MGVEGEAAGAVAESDFCYGGVKKRTSERKVCCKNERSFRPFLSSWGRARS